MTVVVLNDPDVAHVSLDQKVKMTAKVDAGLRIR